MREEGFLVEGDLDLSQSGGSAGEEEPTEE